MGWGVPGEADGSDEPVSGRSAPGRLAATGPAASVRFVPLGRPTPARRPAPTRPFGSGDSVASDAESAPVAAALFAWAERHGGRHPTPRLAERANLFRLARDLRAAGVTPYQAVYSPVGSAACERVGVKPDVLYGRLRPAFARVQVAPADDALSRAMAAADRDAGRFPVPGEPAYFCRILALARHLTPPDPAAWAAFGSARIAAWLGVCRDTVDDAVGRLEELGLVRVLRDKATGKTVWSRARKQARQVRYTGPDPDAAGEAR